VFRWIWLNKTNVLCKQNTTTGIHCCTIIVVCWLLSVCVSINCNFVFLYFAIFVMGWGCLGPRPFLSAGMYTCVCARVRVCAHFDDMVVNHSGTMFISGTVRAQVCHTMIVIVRYVVKLCPSAVLLSSTWCSFCTRCRPKHGGRMSLSRDCNGLLTRKVRLFSDWGLVDGGLVLGLRGSTGVLPRFSGSFTVHRKTQSFPLACGPGRMEVGTTGFYGGP
jgi:hypothetical protein